MTDFLWIFMLLIAMWHGMAEAIVYDGGYKGGNINYQVLTIVMFLFAVIPFLFINIYWYRFIFLMPSIQDGAFFLISEKVLDHKSWSNFRLGGNSILGQWVPNTYIYSIGLYVLLEFLI